MRILMTNHSLMYVGGTEKWTYGMACEMVRRGHQVDVWTFMTGMTSDRLLGIADVVERPDPTGYDLQLINHNTCLSEVRNVPGFKVQTCHGPRHPLEAPQKGADVYVAVSAEVRAEYAMKGCTGMEVITNGLDLGEFKPAMQAPSTAEVPLSTEPVSYKREPRGPAYLTGSPHILCMCKMEKARERIHAACEQLGYGFETMQYIMDPVWDTQDRIRQADVVVGCGRTVIEALACNAEALVLDARNEAKSVRTDGWVTKENVEDLRQCNFSTRRHGRPASTEDVKALLGQYPGRSTWGSGWAAKNADVRLKAEDYLSLMQDQTPDAIHAPDLTTEYEEA